MFFLSTQALRVLYTVNTAGADLQSLPLYTLWKRREEKRSEEKVGERENKKMREEMRSEERI